MGKTSKNIYNRYSREDLEKAIQAVKEGKSCSGAARDLNVPRKTLADHVSGRSKIERRAGRERSIPENIENSIVDRAIRASKAGFPLTKAQFLLKVGRVVERLRLKTPFRKGIPGKDYWYELRKRRPDLTIRKPQNCASNKLAMTTRPVINGYFDELESILQRLQLEDKPTQIWNCDESGLQFSPDASRVIAEKGSKTVIARCSPSKESVTTLVCINAAGRAMPPLCVVKGKTMRAVQSFATKDGPEGTVWTHQTNAWMDDDIGVQWFPKVFLQHCGESRPQLLILDSHHSHEVLEMLELAQEENIHILALPPHTTHILQPLDRVVFKPFKTAYKKHCTEFLSAFPSLSINKVTWPKILQKTWESTMKPELLKTAFLATGIVPLDRKQIPESVFVPADTIQGIPPDDEAMETETDNTQSVPVEVEVSFGDMQDLHGLEIDISGDTMEQPVNVLELASRPTMTDPVDPSASTCWESGIQKSPSNAAPDPPADWNVELANIFGATHIPPSAPTTTTARASRAIKTHRLLTSTELIQAKKAQAEKKEREEAAKQARRENARQRKLEKAQQAK